MEQKNLRKDNPYLDKWFEANRGQLVLIYGKPASGKSTFAIEIAKRAEKPRYIAIDQNLEGMIPENMQAIVPLDYKNLLGLLEKLQDLTPEQINADLIVLDSITTLASDFYEGAKLSSMRVNLEMRRFYDRVFRMLSKIAKKGITIIVIAHESIKKFQGKEGEIIGPAINEIAIRHVDAIYHAIKNGGYKIVREMRRERVENPKFYVEV